MEIKNNGGKRAKFMLLFSAQSVEQLNDARSSMVERVALKVLHGWNQDIV